ncbi:MAG: PD40 domain-containing protein [Actinobacteria bacterium]|nr:PD40 domain-containing protein [Actinomycetota bacterium]
MVAVIGVAAVVFAIRLAGEEDRSQPAVQPIAPDGPYTIDLNTGEMTPLPESLTGGWSYPVSPDGAMFAYSLFPSAGLYVADVDGAGVHEVPTGVPEPQGPSWSPDGSLLVYQGIYPESRPIDRDLYVVDLATDEVRQITDIKPQTLWWWYLPSFAPDGETILFHMPRRSDTGTRWDLWSVPVAGGEPTLVRRDAAMGVYAPDGRTLAYLDAPRSEDGGGWSSSLWLVDADGSDPRLLVDGDFEFLRWSPDGTRIAYAGDGEIHVVDVATGESTHVADGGTAEWFDDDTLVVTPADAD